MIKQERVCVWEKERPWRTGPTTAFGTRSPTIRRLSVVVSMRTTRSRLWLWRACFQYSLNSHITSGNWLEWIDRPNDLVITCFDRAFSIVPQIGRIRPPSTFTCCILLPTVQKASQFTLWTMHELQLRVNSKLSKIAHVTHILHCKAVRWTLVDDITAEPH